MSTIKCHRITSLERDALISYGLGGGSGSMVGTGLIPPEPADAVTTDVGSDNNGRASSLSSPSGGPKSAGKSEASTGDWQRGE